MGGHRQHLQGDAARAEGAWQTNRSGTSEAPDRHTKSQEHPRPYQYPDSSRGAVTQGSVQASEVPSRGCELGEALGLHFQELLGLSQLSEASSWSDFQSTDPAHQTLGLDMASDIHQDPFQMSVSYVNRHQYSFTLMTFRVFSECPTPSHNQASDGAHERLASRFSRIRERNPKRELSFLGSDFGCVRLWGGGLCDVF